MMQKNVLVKNSFIYGISQILSRALSSLLLPLFTAYLTPSDYGIASMLTMLNLCAVAVFTLGLGPTMGLVYFENDDKKHHETVLFTSFILMVLMGVFLSIVAYPLNQTISHWFLGSRQYGYFIMITIISTSFAMISMPFSLAIQYNQRALLLGFLSLLSSVINIILNVLFVIVLKKGISGWIVAGCIANALSLLIYMLPNFFTMHWKYSPPVVKRLIKYGIPVIPGTFFTFIINNSSRQILQWKTSMAEVGIYSLGYNFGMICYLFVNAFSLTWGPYLMSIAKDQSYTLEKVSSVFQKYSTIFLLVCALFFIFAKPVVMLITHPNFHSSYKVVGVIALGFSCTGLHNILLCGAIIEKKMYILMYSQGLAALASVLLSYLFIPLFGIFGAACVFFISNFLVASFLHLLTQWVQLPVPHLPIKEMSPYILLLTLSAAVSLYPRDWNLNQELALALMQASVIVIAALRIISDMYKHNKWVTAE